MPRRIGPPFLSPRFVFKYPPNLTIKVLRGFYAAFSHWQEMLYPEVIAETPISQGIDPRQPKGLLRKHIRLMWSTGEQGLKYKAIGVPGGTVYGSPAYHALSAVRAYHGATGRPLTIKPVSKEVLTFPLGRAIVRNPQVLRQGPGRSRGPRNWVVTRKVYQPRWAPPNPWIIRIWNEKAGLLPMLLYQELSKVRRERKTIEVA